MLRRLRILVTTLLLGVAVTLSAQAPPGQDGFVPAASVPRSEELPAGPLVIASYAFFLLLMMFYLWTVWRRIGKVEREILELQRRQGSSTR
jgi:hypothetical protein